MNRRDFTKASLLAGTALITGASSSFAADPSPKRIRTGLIGCGSVSNQYLPQLTKSPFVEVVSLCDIKPERAKRQAERYHTIGNRWGSTSPQRSRPCWNVTSPMLKVMCGSRGRF